MLKQLAVLECLLFLFGGVVRAQERRISGPIDESRRVILPGTIPPKARTGFDLGPVEPSRKIGPMVVLLTRSSEQQAAVEKLLEDQRDPSSPNFHKWLTPEQYADQFGLRGDDLSAVRQWIESHGLSIDHAARGGNWIGFSGTAAQVESALGAQIHRYRIGTEEYYANASEISIPAALAPVVGAFAGLNDFRSKPQFTNLNGTHSLAPDDLAILYDLNPLYSSGIDGTGQTIAIVGESALEPNLADIHAFRDRFLLPGPDPRVVLYGPDPGVTTLVTEADLDIEAAATVARNASITYVYSSSFILSSIYAVDQNLAPVISDSFGSCEQEYLYLGVLFQSMIQQANVQGITYVASAGDAGPSNCTGAFNEPFSTDGLGVNFPASIPEVTGVGGTEFNEGGANYWSTTNTAQGASVLSYIPEIAWNDSAAVGTIQAGGGGPSILYAKPSWQTGPGVPADNVRDTPDVAMTASAYHDAPLFCSQGACGTSGGTSFAAPVFAAIVALMNQSVVSRGVQSQPGLGNINPTLYQLGGNTTAGVFHDITVGNNIVLCGSGTPDCATGSFGYSAAPGYDMATGWGSVDAFKLVNAWGTFVDLPGNQTVISAVADNTSILMSGSVGLTITVSPSVGGNVPGGTLYVNLTNTPTPGSALPGELLLATGTLAQSGRGMASALLRIYGGQLNPGDNTLTITYAGNAQFNANATTITIHVDLPTTNSAVVPLIYPYDQVYDYPPVANVPPNSSGFKWQFLMKLTEAAGIATQVTSFSVNGVDESSMIATVFGSSVLPPKGTLLGVWNFNPQSVPSTIPVTFGGQDASGFAWNIQIQVPLVGGPEQFVAISNGGLVNAASSIASFAPGMIMSVFGADLTNPGGSTGQAQTLPLPLTLSGSSATINGVSAPYYYVSPGFANIQIPYETALGNATLIVTGLFGQTFNYVFKVQPAAPGIFLDPKTGAPVPYESASPGQEVALYITGEGRVTPALATGASPAPGTPASNLPQPALPVTVTVGGKPAQVVFLGIVPGLVGATQINYVIPADAPSGSQAVVVTVGGVASPPANIVVTPTHQ
jgi:uncharacterized protein (TIGR03437 family)